MRIGIAGAGAVGAYYGVRLQKAGLWVQMLARGAHCQAMKNKGLRYVSKGLEECVQVMVDDAPSCLQGCDIVLFSCKTTQLETMCIALKNHIKSDAVLISMQNGVMAAETIASVFPNHAVVAASAFIGARLEQPGYLIHSAAGHIRLGFWSNCHQTHVAPVLKDLLVAWQQAGVDVKQVEDAEVMLWHKMLWNCGFNAITALTRCYARAVLENAQGRALVLAAMQETVAVARAKGVMIDATHIEQHLQLTRQAGAVKTSMWQDIAHGRPTEIGAMNGYVVALGEQYMVATPVNQMLTSLIILAEGRQA